MPSLIKLYEEFADQDFVVLAVDIQEERELVAQYAARQKMAFPVLLDTTGKVAFRYGVRAHPAHFLVDRQGQLVAAVLGARDWAGDKARAMIRHLLEQPAAQ